MTTFGILFDGSTDPGTVILSDGLIEARASFATDEEAKRFYGLLLELRDHYDVAHGQAVDLSRMAQELAGKTLSVMARTTWDMKR